MKLFSAVFVSLAAFSLAVSAAPAPSAAKEPRIGLVLSGGGARGFAHIGVLKVLEEAGVKVSFITATSMGSMVGGGYAEGYSPEELASIVRGVNWTQMFGAKPRREDLNWRRKQDKEKGLGDQELGIGAEGFALPYGIITCQELDLFLAKVNEPASKTRDLSKLPIPYAAFATDLVTGQPVKLQKNITLSTAMRSSMSIPGAFAPSEWDGKLLVDGGLVQNLPVQAARDMGADIIIAVNVGTPLSSRESLGSIAGVLSQMINILTEQNVQKSLSEITEKDILITPDLSAFTSGDFLKADDIMKAGEDAARKIFDKLAAIGAKQKGFAEWNEARRAPTKGDRKHVVADVRVDGLKTINPEKITKEIDIKPGETVSSDEVEKMARSIWHDDDFLSVPYHFEPGPDGMEVLVFEPQEKTWGYSSFRFGGRVETDFSDTHEYSFLLEHTLGWLNEWGGELRTGIQIGKDASFEVQLYQPLGVGSPFYVRPRLYGYRQHYDRYVGKNCESTWRNDVFLASTELGFEFSKYGTISVGGGYTYQKNSRVVGNDSMRDPDGGSLMAFAALNIDRLDNTNFPTNGYKLNATATRFLDDMGTSGDKNTYDVSGTIAASYGPWTFAAAAKGGRSTLEGSFRLGGAFNLTGSSYGQYSGDHMAFGRVMAYRILNQKLLEIGVPIWGGISLEAGRAYNAQDSDRPSWKKAAGLFIGADTWIGPIYLVTGKTFGGNSAVYMMWGHIQ